MLRGLARTTARVRTAVVKAPAVQFSSAKYLGDIQTEEWFLWPRQKEGNIYDHNYSLVDDGIVPEGNAYRNARVALLTNEMGAKINEGKVEVKGPQYFGEFRVSEAGDDMSHEIFSEFFAAQQQELSSIETTPNLFVEDASLGSHTSVRNGVRVTSSNPAVALMFRSLLIPTPPYQLNHRARFKGWNLDPRFVVPKPVWNGKHYDFENELPAVPKAGQRPIVAFVGGDNSLAAVQFVEFKSEIVGANVMVGSQVPVRGIIHAIGHAACVLKNTQHANSVTLPCTVLAQGKHTAAIFGGSDDLAEAAADAGLLYGAYHNTLSAEGVSAVWGGYIGSAAKAQATHLGSQSAPVVVVGGRAAVHAHPNNLANPAKHIVFYEKGAAKSKLSADEAHKRILTLTEEAKSDVIKAILQNASVSIVGSPADLKSIF